MMQEHWLPTVEILATLFAGLGLFFVGIRLIGENLRQLADRRLRLLVQRATQSQRSAAPLGLAAGAITQSIHAVILILISLVRAGVMDLRRAQPVINFANIGTALLVLVAALDLTLMVLVLVGATGMLYYFDRDRSPRMRNLSRALLGVGLLFLGLMFIKQGAYPLSELPWVGDLMELSGQSLLIAFASGAVLAVVAHSASSITILTMALAAGGVIDLEYGLMLVLGAGLGTGLGTLLLIGHAGGIARHLALYQLTLKSLGLLPLLALFWLEFYGGVPLLVAGLAALPVGISLQIAFSYILYQVVCDLTMHPLHHRVQHWLDRYAPPTREEAFGKPSYLYEGARKDAGSALVLAEREQRRLLERLPLYLDTIRQDVQTPRNPGTTSLHRASHEVGIAIERFLDETLAEALSGATLDHAIILKNRNQLLLSLQETLYQLVNEVERTHAGQDPTESTPQLTDSMVETLHMLLLMVLDAVEDGDAEDLAMLQSLTEDRSELMDGIRRKLLASQELQGTTRDAVFAATSLFERGVWLLRRYAMLLQGPQKPLVTDSE